MGIVKIESRYIDGRWLVWQAEAVRGIFVYFYIVSDDMSVHVIRTAFLFYFILLKLKLGTPIKSSLTDAPPTAIG